jgi:hypothetical protein
VTVTDGHKSEDFNLGRAFLTRQVALSRELEIPLSFTTHPTTIGDGSEANWVRMLGSFLPRRYAIGPIFALDAVGGQSEQIDLAIYDQQYSPLWFEIAGKLFVPVESVYAAFEVKPTITKAYLEYAANKVASVRELARTSEKIVDYQGVHDGARPENRPIIGGIVALNASWVGGLRGGRGTGNIQALTGSKHLDLGIALTDAAFDNVPEGCNEMLEPGLSFSKPGTQLIYFVMHLFRRLQATGTALAVDLKVYEKALDDVDPDAHRDVNDADWPPRV